MYKYISLLLVSLVLFTPQKGVALDSVSKYLTEYFGTSDYTTFEEVLPIGAEKLYVTVKYLDKEKKIFDKGIGYVVEEDTLIAYIFFNQNQILNSENAVIFDITKHNLEPYGWKLVYSLPKQPSVFGNGFSMTLISDKGQRVTDGPRIEWNNDTKKFQERVFDRSMFK